MCIGNERVAVDISKIKRDVAQRMRGICRQ